MYTHVYLSVCIQNHEFTVISPITITIPWLTLAFHLFISIPFLSCLLVTNRAPLFSVYLLTCLIPWYVNSVPTTSPIFLASATDSDLPTLAASFFRVPVLPEPLLCLICSVINVLSEDFFFLIGLENSKATCVLAGSDHSASLTGRNQLFKRV